MVVLTRGAQVAALYRFETEDEVISLANDTDVGLASYVFTNSLSRAWRVSEGLESGMVGLSASLSPSPPATEKLTTAWQTRCARGGESQNVLDADV